MINKNNTSMMTLLENINALDNIKGVSFAGSSFFGNGVYTIQRVTERAIQVNGDWIPKSQITNIRGGLVKKDCFVIGDNVEYVEISINKWFEDKLFANQKSSSWIC